MGGTGNDLHEANLHPSRPTSLLLRSLTLQQSATAGLTSFSGAAFVRELQSSNSKVFSSPRVGEVSEFYPYGPTVKYSFSFNALSTMLHTKKGKVEEVYKVSRKEILIRQEEVNERNA